MESPAYIGFPPPLLGDKPRRLKVLEKRDGFFALEKPFGVVSDAHPMSPKSLSLASAIKVQAEGKKPELDPLFIRKLHSIYYLEPEISGISLFTTQAEARAHYNNLYGSNLFEFKFTFLVRGTGVEDGLSCSLPLAVHRNEARALVSHRTGKKCETRFSKIETIGPFELWEANTRYIRPHQIRLHAAEVGLRLVGESTYEGGGGVAFSDFEGQENRRGGIRYLTNALCIHLHRIECEPEGLAVEFPVQKGFTTLIRRMKNQLTR